MSWIIDNGVELFIPFQDYNLTKEEWENINPNVFSRNAKGTKVKKKKSRRKGPKKDKDMAFLEEEIRRKEIKEKTAMLASISVRMEPLDFSDYVRGETSFGNSFRKALAFRDFFSCYIDVEKELEVGFDNSILDAITSVFLQNVPPEMVHIVTPFNAEKIYASVLHRFQAELAIETARMILDCGILEKFPPKKTPMVHCVLQKSFDDLYPSSQSLIPFKVLADIGVVPYKALNFKVPGELICFSLFWSVCRIHTAFGIIYKKKDGNLGFYWTVYNRSKSLTAVLDRTVFKMENSNVFNIS